MKDKPNIADDITQRIALEIEAQHDHAAKARQPVTPVASPVAEAPVAPTTEPKRKAGKAGASTLPDQSLPVTEASGSGTSA
jgi:hypothetical protein